MKAEIDDIWNGINDNLRNFVLSKTGDPELSDDIVQDVFLKVHDNIQHLNDEEKISSWIFQITRNRIYDEFRLRKKQGFKASIEDSMEIADSSAEEELESFIDCVIPMIAALPPKYRIALTLSEIDGLSQKELAEKLDISYSGAKSRVQRGRQKLKEMLMQYCHIETDKYGNVLSQTNDNCCDAC